MGRLEGTLKRTATVLLALLAVPLAWAQAPARLTEATGGGVTFTDSNLPIVVIETTNSQPIPDEPKITALMGIIANSNGANSIDKVLSKGD